MKATRITIALFLALVMTVTVLPTTVLAASHTFTDVTDNQWYSEAVEYVYANGLMQGYDDNTFRPNDQLSRAEAVQIIYNYEKQPTVNVFSTGFDDVPSSAWYASAVVWATREGIVTGISDTTFNPNDRITRQDMITVLWRYVVNLHTNKYNPDGDYSRFPDANEVASYASAAVNWAVKNSIINGVDINGTIHLNPRGNTSRAEMATILMGFIHAMLEADGTEVELGNRGISPQNTYINSYLLLVSTDSGSMGGITVAVDDGTEVELADPQIAPGFGPSNVGMYMVPNATSYTISNTSSAAIRVALCNAYLVLDIEIEPDVSAKMTISDTASGCNAVYESTAKVNGSVTMRFDDSLALGVSSITVNGSFDGTASVTKSNDSVLVNGFDFIETINKYGDGSTISNSYASLSGQAAEINDVFGVITVNGVKYYENLSATAPIPALSPPAGLSFTNGFATWNAVSGAEYYEVRVLKNGQIIGMQRSTHDCYYDFSNYIREEGAAYTFEVSASGTGYLDSAFTESNAIYKASTLARPDNVRFSQGIATWSGVQGATGYELTLYNYSSGQKVSSDIIVVDTVYDFTPILRNNVYSNGVYFGVYYYSIKALGDGISSANSLTSLSNNYSYIVFPDE